MKFEELKTRNGGACVHYRTLPASLLEDKPDHAASADGDTGTGDDGEPAHRHRSYSHSSPGAKSNGLTRALSRRCCLSRHLSTDRYTSHSSTHCATPPSTADPPISPPSAESPVSSGCCGTAGGGSVKLPVLSFSVDQLAGQITLADMAVFASIEPCELTSLGWQDKRLKHSRAPHVVALTGRFNQVSFWVVKEILSAAELKQRVAVMAHMIRLARRLHELGNLHAQFAVLSALQTTPVFRLHRTWSLLPKSLHQKFDKQAELFDKENNWQNLRQFLSHCKLPCIPYLGLYLTDLVYIDVVYGRAVAGTESDKRRQDSVNNIMRTISEFQQSDYSHIAPLPPVTLYLGSRHYIDELQKFVDDDNYKLSLQLEPLTSLTTARAAGTAGTLPAAGVAGAVAAPADRSGAVTRSDTLPASARVSQCVPQRQRKQHRRCYSLDQCRVPDQSSVTVRHLLDDSLLTPAAPSSCLPASATATATATASGGGNGGADDNNSDPVMENDTAPDNHDDDEDDDDDEDEGDDEFSAASPFIRVGGWVERASLSRHCPVQGVVWRKAVLKHGRKCHFAAWRCYWLQLYHGSHLVYYPSKTLQKGLNRSDFRPAPCKHHSVLHWSVLSDRPGHDTDTILLHHVPSGRMYKLRLANVINALWWLKHLTQACSGGGGGGSGPQVASTQTVDNLITFE